MVEYLCAYLVLGTALAASTQEDCEKPEGNCYVVESVAVDDDGHPLRGVAPHKVQSGRALSPAACEAVGEAIALIKKWEGPRTKAADNQGYDLEKFEHASGTKSFSSVLDTLHKGGRICEEALKGSVRLAGSAWSGSFEDIRGQALIRGTGEGSIHVAADYLPLKDGHLAEQDLYDLAFLLLHEVAHVKDSRWEAARRRGNGLGFESQIEVEVPIYTWHIGELAKILGDASISRALKVALRESLEHSIAYCSDALTIDPQIETLGAKALGDSIVARTADRAVTSLSVVGDRTLIALDSLGGMTVFNTKKQFSTLKRLDEGPAVDSKHAYNAVAVDQDIVVTSADGNTKFLPHKFEDGGDYIQTSPSHSITKSYVLDDFNRDLTFGDTFSFTLSEGGRFIWIAGANGHVFRLKRSTKETPKRKIVPGRSFTSLVTVGDALVLGTTKNELIVFEDRGDDMFEDDAEFIPMRLESGPRTSELNTEGGVSALASTAEGYFAVGCKDGSVFLTLPDSRTPIPQRDVIELVGHAGTVREIVFDPQLRWMATADDKGLVLLWGLGTLQLHHAFRQSAAGLAPFNDGDWLAVGGVIQYDPLKLIVNEKEGDPSAIEVVPDMDSDGEEDTGGPVGDPVDSQQGVVTFLNLKPSSKRWKQKR